MVSNDVAALGPGESVRGAAADPEGAGDRAPRRAPARARGLPAADGAGARRARSRRAAPLPLRREGRDRARGAHVARRLRRWDGGFRPPTTASRGRGARRRIEPTLSPEELELLRIQAGTPAWGKEIDDRVLPAEAGLTERAVSFTKGCYPGQEPIARLHYRGHANRGLRVLRARGALPAPDAELLYEGKSVGRITSAARDGRRLRRARLRPARGPGGRRARSRPGSRLPSYTDHPRAPVAQGIERCPAEAEVARSNRAGRIAGNVSAL